MTEYGIVGCGNVGRRVVQLLIESGVAAQSIYATVNSQASAERIAADGVMPIVIDLDEEHIDAAPLHERHCFYFVAPQKAGRQDLRSELLLKSFSEQKVRPAKVVLISTTGVYGDAGGEWVDEASVTKPQTDRGARRLSMEQQWVAWAQRQGVAICVLRVPGIYANDRIPRERLEKGTPVVMASECGFSNRIHADDLAAVCMAARNYSGEEVIFNATDGVPGKITEYLQAAAEVLELPPLPEISMARAKEELSAGMLSYLSESRKISNEKMKRELKVTLRYPNFRVGLRH